MQVSKKQFRSFSKHIYTNLQKLLTNCKEFLKNYKSLKNSQKFFKSYKLAKKFKELKNYKTILKNSQVNKKS